MASKVDKWGRAYASRTLVQIWNDGGPTKLTLLGEEVWFSTPELHEILATNWTSTVPEHFEPPRDAKGRPVCNGDVILHGGIRWEVQRGYATSPGGSIPGDYFSRGTVVRFAGEERDVGEAASEWRQLPSVYGCEVHEHTSGAQVWQWAAVRQWYWRGSNSERSDPAQGSAATLAEAQRIALTPPFAMPKKLTPQAAAYQGALREAVNAIRSAPAIVAETEQSLEKRFADFRKAVEAACPEGCSVVADRIQDPRRDAHALVILTSHGKRYDALFRCDEGGRWTSGDVVPERWIRETVAALDRAAGERLRRGGR